jgi:hypothetical protein
VCVSAVLKLRGKLAMHHTVKTYGTLQNAGLHKLVLSIWIKTELLEQQEGI